METYPVRRRLALASLGATLLPPSIQRAIAQAPLERPEIKLGIGADWGTSAHAIVASTKGFFKEEGFKQVELKFFAAGLVQLEALAAGGIDIANPTQAPVMTLRGAGVPVVVLSSLCEYFDATALVVKKTAAVKEPGDLYKLKIGLLKGSGAELMVLAIARHYRLDPSKLQFVNLAPPEQLSSLAAGAIDGVCVWQPWVYQIARKIDVDVVHTGAHSGFQSNKGERVRVDFTRSLLITSERFLKSNVRTVDALVRSYARAQQFMADTKNSDEAVGIFSNYHKQDVAMNRALLKEYRNTMALNEDYLRDMEAFQDYLMQSGRMKRKVEVPQITYGGALAKVDPKLITQVAQWKL